MTLTVTGNQYGQLS